MSRRACENCGRTLAGWYPEWRLCSWCDGSVLVCVCPVPEFDGIECRVCFRRPTKARLRELELLKEESSPCSLTR